MYPPILAPSTEELSPLVHEVRAYLVDARGGAPFLSAADSQLLMDWLESKVPVPLILAAIDRVAARRRKKRVRSRLTLRACRGEVHKALKKQAARNPSGAVAVENARPPSAAKSAPHKAALSAVIQELEEHDVDPRHAPLWRILIERLTQLSTQELTGEACTSSTLQAVRVFQRDAWDAMREDHEDLRSAARIELAPLEGAVSERIFMELLEEGARDQLRRRFALVSADRLWDRLQP